MKSLHYFVCLAFIHVAAVPGTVWGQVENGEASEATGWMYQPQSLWPGWKDRPTSRGARLVAMFPNEDPAAESHDDAMAKDAAGSSDDWQFEIAPFLWATYLRYDASVGPIGASGDVDFTDLASILDMGFSLHAEARKNRFGAFLEGSYILSSADDRANVGPVPVLGIKAEAELALTQITLGGMYRLGEPGRTLDLMAGVRYTQLDADMSIGPFLNPSFTKEFLDPMVAARLRWDYAEKWRLALRGEAGGFGVDTELTWGLQGTIGYRLRENVVLEVGYRYFDMELEKGPLHLEQQVHGPIIGLAISF